MTTSASGIALISTGSKSIDSILGGGIRSGMLTDIYGESGAGKSQLCFTICANCIKSGGTALFIDTAGTFRPERILEIAGISQESGLLLEKIKYVRALTVLDQINATKKIPDVAPELVIVDTLTSLFSAEYSGAARHLAVMGHLRDLALHAVNSGCAVVVTNMVRSVPITIVDQAGHNVDQAVVPSEQREYLGSSVSLYSHIRLKLEIVNAPKYIFQAILMQPPADEDRAAKYTIRTGGISDIEEKS